MSGEEREGAGRRGRLAGNRPFGRLSHFNPR
jgi:hypothetical protein